MELEYKRIDSKYKNVYMIWFDDIFSIISKKKYIFIL